MPSDPRVSKLENVPCLIGCLALSAPRVVLLVLWLFTDYVGWAYETKFWPFLGWIFLPTTTLAYAFAMHYGERAWTPIGIAAMVTALLIDLGLLGTSSRSRRRRAGGGDGGSGSSGGGGAPREIVIEGRRVG